jgi:hypothetical protein
VVAGAFAGRLTSNFSFHKNLQNHSQSLNL